MQIQGTDIQILKNWCTALENQIKKTNESEKKEPLEKQLFTLEEKDSLHKKQRTDILKNILLLINFNKDTNECNDDDIAEIITRVRTLIEAAENDKMDITKSEA